MPPNLFFRRQGSLFVLLATFSISPNSRSLAAPYSLLVFRLPKSFANELWNPPCVLLSAFPPLFPVIGQDCLRRVRRTSLLRSAAGPRLIDIPYHGRVIRSPSLAPHLSVPPLNLLHSWSTDFPPPYFPLGRLYLERSSSPETSPPPCLLSRRENSDSAWRTAISRFSVVCPSSPRRFLLPPRRFCWLAFAEAVSADNFRPPPLLEWFFLFPDVSPPVLPQARRTTLSPTRILRVLPVVLHLIFLLFFP